MVCHGLLHDGDVLTGHQVQHSIVPDGSVLSLTLSMHLQDSSSTYLMSQISLRSSTTSQETTGCCGRCREACRTMPPVLAAWPCAETFKISKFGELKLLPLKVGLCCSCFLLCRQGTRKTDKRHRYKSDMCHSWGCDESSRVSTHLQEDPVNVLVEHCAVDVPEAVQHPGLLIISKVLNRKVVAQRIAGLDTAQGHNRSPAQHR